MDLMCAKIAIMDFSDELQTKGFAISRDVIAADDLVGYRDAVEMALRNNPSRDPAPGLRNVFEIVDAAREFAVSPQLRQLIEPILGSGYFASRALIFDKTFDDSSGANWKVPFHQDLTIAVKEKIEADGFSAWSLKEGVLHVQPPVEILERMLTVRLHLDDCDSDNGALRVLPASHLVGRLGATDIQKFRQARIEEICVVPAGGVLLMRPLLLHASSEAKTRRRRRVMHLEFSCEELPHGLEWQWRH